MLKNCDLVMKGGITSGIVYPAAVCELAKDFRFASIGGTSAGAIAAALTAAAEYRRQNGSDDGFRELEQLPENLAGTRGGKSALLALFQPSEESAALLDVAMAWIETTGPWWKKSIAIAAKLMSRFNRYASMVIAAGALFLIVAIAAMFTTRSGLLAGGLLLTVLATIVVTLLASITASLIEAFVTSMRVLPKQGFGICSGMSRGGDALTQWLSKKIDAIGAASSPLTFGDLRAQGINLEVMTTNLTHGRPYRLPFETRRFLFAPSEMRGLFPENVVQWMIDHARPQRRRYAATDGETLYALPEPDQLPVVVATRMSLSFPLLLSAVPLWAVDFGRKHARRVPEHCWFSDGGITSNFPVHFFDKPLPRWPTFAFNLAEWTPRYHEAGQRIYTPRTNRDGILEWWEPIATVAQFLRAIVATMQNWRDNMLLRLPGQRDRIAHVLLQPREGGLNLTMSPQTIAGVAEKGREAAGALRSRFAGSPPPGVTLTWSNHKWVRFLAFMPALEETLESWSRAFGDETVPPSVDDLLEERAPLPSYKVVPAQREKMRDASLAFLQHIQRNFGSSPFRTPARRPRPEPELRAMPRE